MPSSAFSWNGGNGHRTRIHVTGEGHATAICGVVVPHDNEDAEVREHEFPLALKRSRSVCGNCIRVASDMELRIFYDPKKGESKFSLDTHPKL